MERFLSIREELHNHYRPSTPAETMLIDAYAYARARVEQIWAMQKEVLDRAAASGPLTNFPRAFDTLAEYEFTLERRIEKICRDFARLKPGSQGHLHLTRIFAIRKGTQQPIENTASSVGAS